VHIKKKTDVQMFAICKRASATKMIVTTLLAIFVAVEARLPRSAYSDDLRNCQFDRNDAIDCAVKYGDLNGDRLLDANEIVTLKAAMFTILERFVALLYPVSHIMEHCDADQDGKISESDFDKSLETCLATCDRVTTFNRLVCTRAKRTHYKPPVAAKE
jgi:hypothetical protein